MARDRHVFYPDRIRISGSSEYSDDVLFLIEFARIHLDFVVFLLGISLRRVKKKEKNTYVSRDLRA